MKCLIISGGNPPAKELLLSEMENSSIVICADRGTDCVYKYGILPNMIMGDFDSINKDVLKYYESKNVKIEYFSKDKKFTDTELALNKAIELKADKISLLGCTGTRLDHFLGNVGLLYKCLNLGISAEIIDNNNKITIHNHSFKTKGKYGNYFSIIPYSHFINNLTVKNAKYPLDNYDLKTGEGYTISNEFTEKEIDITFDNGILLLIRSKD